MIKIISDTSTLYSVEEGKNKGLIINPLSVTINNEDFKEYVEITPKEFVKKIKLGAMPSTSQPSIGQTINLYEKYKENEIINITLADGLSGTFSSACAAKESIENNENIHIINSKTLCGCQRHLVEKAVELVEKGCSVNEIIKTIEELSATAKSFLIPKDLEYLKRGGRLTPIAAKVGGLLKVVPILTTTKNNDKIEKFAIKRTINSAIDTIIKEFEKSNINEDYKIYICHGDNIGLAEKIKERIEDAYHNIEIEIYELSPVFITHAGPESVAIQAIKK